MINKLIVKIRYLITGRDEKAAKIEKAVKRGVKEYEETFKKLAQT